MIRMISITIMIIFAMAVLSIAITITIACTIIVLIIIVGRPAATGGRPPAARWAAPSRQPTYYCITIAIVNITNIAY